MGDAEADEGNVEAAIIEASRYKAGNVMIKLDYNRQSLDGNTAEENKAAVFRAVYEAKGWKVIELRWGRRLRAAFSEEQSGAAGPLFEKVMNALTEPEYQYLLTRDGAAIKSALLHADILKRAGISGAEIDVLNQYLRGITDKDFYTLYINLGGHDIRDIYAAQREAHAQKDVPTLILLHTIKGWGSKALMGRLGNHSQLLKPDELKESLKDFGVSPKDPFKGFSPKSREGQLLARARKKYRVFDKALKKQIIDNQWDFICALEELAHDAGGFPSRIDPAFLRLRGARNVSTQDAFGEIMAKMMKLIDTPDEELSPQDRVWKLLAVRFVFVGPDVLSSTGLAQAMKGQVYGPERDVSPIIPSEAVEKQSWLGRVLRMSIKEDASVSMGLAFGMTWRYFGVLTFPVVAIYDMFFSRAMDQLRVGQYTLAKLILWGSPSGSALFREGAQHQSVAEILYFLGLQNTIVWSPGFADELDIILGDTYRRMAELDDEGRNLVYIRGSTVPLDRSLLFSNLARQKVYRDLLAKHPLQTDLKQPEGNLSSEEEEAYFEKLDQAEKEWKEKIIRTKWEEEVRQGGYTLVDPSNDPDYDTAHAVQIVTTGVLIEQALKAAEALRNQEHPIFAKVIVVTSPSLLVGTLGRKNGYYKHFKTLIPKSERHIPIVTAIDAAPEVLEGVAKIWGTRTESLGIRQNGTATATLQEMLHHHSIDDLAMADSARLLQTERDRDNEDQKPTSTTSAAPKKTISLADLNLRLSRSKPLEFIITMLSAFKLIFHHSIKPSLRDLSKAA